MATAGFNFAIMHPGIYIAALDPITGRGPTWPSRIGKRLTLAQATALGWERWWGTTNGLRLTVNDPQANILTADRGILGQVSTGAHGITVASQTKTPTLNFLEWLTKMGSDTVAATGGTAEVQTLTVAGTTAAASGNAIVVLDGQVYTVPIASSDTPTLAATALRNPANYTPALQGWTLSGATTAVIYTATGPGAKTSQFSASLPSALTGSFAETTPGVNPTYTAGEIKYHDFTGEYGSVQRFTMFAEGTSPPGSLADQALFVRVVLHQLNQGGNTVLPFDDSGADAPFALSLASVCEPRAVSPLELLGTGFDDDHQDPNGKASYWISDLQAA